MREKEQDRQDLSESENVSGWKCKGECACVCVWRASVSQCRNSRWAVWALLAEELPATYFTCCIWPACPLSWPTALTWHSWNSCLPGSLPCCSVPSMNDSPASFTLCAQPACLPALPPWLSMPDPAIMTQSSQRCTNLALQPGCLTQHPWTISHTALSPTFSTDPVPLGDRFPIMGRWRNKIQMKEKEEPPEKGVN